MRHPGSDSIFTRGSESLIGGFGGEMVMRGLQRSKVVRVALGKSFRIEEGSEALFGEDGACLFEDILGAIDGASTVRR